jgi:nitroimidazol reductase NimA-like FMN-containing flavoprotein (pyridoxamine 5'-phosphate oxidase superfamily)
LRRPEMEVAHLPAVDPDLDARERACVEEVLRTAQLAYVAMVEPAAPPGTVRPYVVPMNFAYESPAAAPPTRGAASEGRLLLHTGAGRKVEALRQNARVCVSVTAHERLELGDTPCDDGYLYHSVVLEGRAELLTDELQREQALRAIVDKYDPEAAGKPFKPELLATTLIYAVEVETIGFKERPKRR